MDDSVDPIIRAWQIIEDTLTELGVGPVAERGAKAIVARLAAHEPPILLCYPSQMKDDQ